MKKFSGKKSFIEQLDLRRMIQFHLNFVYSHFEESDMDESYELINNYKQEERKKRC